MFKVAILGTENSHAWHFAGALKGINGGKLFEDIDLIGVYGDPSAEDAQKGNAVAMVLVHVGLDFEHEARELTRRGVDHVARERVGVRRRRRCQTQEVFEERLHAEVRERGSEEYR